MTEHNQIVFDLQAENPGMSPTPLVLQQMVPSSAQLRFIIEEKTRLAAPSNSSELNLFEVAIAGLNKKDKSDGKVAGNSH